MQRKLGLTPTEVVISMVSASVLVWGLASTLKLVSISYDRPASASWQTLEAAKVLETMMADLSQASTFLTRTPHEIHFATSQRNADGTPQTIRYWWSGNEGDPLLYQVNGGTEIRLAESVKHLNLEYMTRQFEVGNSTVGVPSSPQSLEFHEPCTETPSSSSVTALSLDTPSDTEAGDLLIAAVSVDSGFAGLVADGGDWIPIVVQSQGTSLGHTFGVWYKIAGSNEPASHSFSWPSSKHAYGWVMRFTGHNPSDPIHAVAYDQGDSDTPSSPEVATSVDNALILRTGGFRRGRINIGDPGLPGHTPINMNRSGSSTLTGVSGGSGYTTLPTAGLSGTSNFSLTGSNVFNTVTIAIEPDSGD